MALVTNRLRRLPIRLRLTVWYGVLLAAVMVLFGVALWIGLRVRLDGAFDDQLRDQAALTLAAVETQGGTLSLNAGELLAARQIGSFVRLIGRDGQVIADTSPPGSAIPLDQGDVRAALAGETRFSSVEVGDRPVRMVTIPVTASGAVAGVLQVGMSRSEIDEVMNEVLVAILIAAPAAVLAALGGGYLLARRALAPVAAITRLAAGIGGGNDLHARLGLTLPDDELGHLAATFDGMLDRIEAAFERQRRFTGDAAHELRTPLMLMRGRIDLARERPRSSADYLAALDGLDSDLVRLTDVVGALLMLARSDTGRLTIERDAFDLAETMGWVAQQYAESAEAAGVELRAAVTATPVEGDEDLIMQVLVNLVDNALAHTSPGDVVTLGCQATSDSVQFWVADTGTGIAPEHQERVFDRFYRADPGRARHAGGIGLGLSLCRAIAEAHGGRIALTSELGHGTRVEVRLPITPPAGV
jgi:two-component system OmpR family sensor kinase